MIAAPSSLHYHQQPALLHNVVRYLHDLNATSLLDIGAGSPYLAVPLSKQVRRYCAVERHPQRVSELRSAGLDVIEGTFPLPIQGTYDVVLSSHSVPEGSAEAYPSFLAAAWGCTSGNGLMLIVTFKGSSGPLAELRRDLLGGDPPRSREFNEIMKYCVTRGATNVRHVNSYVEAATAPDVAEFLLPWLSGKPPTRERLRGPLIDILETQYRVRDSLFVFPTQHLFISCRKAPKRIRASTAYE